MTALMPDGTAPQPRSRQSAGPPPVRPAVAPAAWRPARRLERGLTIQAQQQPPLIVCALHGSQTLVDVPRLVDGVRAALRIHPDGAIVVDLSGVDRLSAAVVSALLGLARVTHARGRELSLRGLDGTALGPGDARRLLVALGDASAASDGGRVSRPGA